LRFSWASMAFQHNAETPRAQGKPL
jgi:hypothetical protein